MKQIPGFLPAGEPKRETTPYDSYIGKFVRLDVSGGIGATGVLYESSRLEHGYAFSLSPSVFQSDESLSIINEPVLVTSNGSPISFCPIPRSIEDFVKNRNSKKEPSRIITYSK